VGKSEKKPAMKAIEGKRKKSIRGAKGGAQEKGNPPRKLRKTPAGNLGQRKKNFWGQGKTGKV